MGNDDKRDNDNIEAVRSRIEGLVGEVRAKQIKELEQRAATRLGLTTEGVDQLFANAAASFEGQVASLQDSLGLDPARARLLARSINSIDHLASEIADSLGWEHGPEAVEKAHEIASYSDGTPEGIRKIVEFGNARWAMAVAYQQAVRAQERVLEGSLVSTIGDVATIAGTLLRSIVELSKGQEAAKTAGARWSKLDTTKSWVFQQRKDNPDGSRTSFIRARVATIREMAREAGAALSGDDAAVIRTVNGWCRDAGID